MKIKFISDEAGPNDEHEYENAGFAIVMTTQGMSFRYVFRQKCRGVRLAFGWDYEDEY